MAAVLHPHPWYNVWLPTAQEKAVYFQLFQAASRGNSIGGAPAVTGAMGVAFLQQSGLPLPVLKQVRAVVCALLCGRCLNPLCVDRCGISRMPTGEAT